MRRNNRKRKNSKLLLALVVLGISIGFAYLSTTLGINGIAGIKGNKWSIHWDDTSIKTTEGSITPTTAAYVTDTKKENIDFSVQLELPGDFYEFTVDAINDGTIAGKISKIEANYYQNETKIDKPSYYNFSITHSDGSEVGENEILPANAKYSYKVRIEFDKEATTLPNAEDTEIEIKVPVGPTDSTKYLVEYNPNGGNVSPLAVEVEKTTSIGDLPVATKENSTFDGWYTEITGGEKITSSYVPISNMKLYAHWSGPSATFDIGQIVNAKIKQLAGNTDATYETQDSNITKIEKAPTEPDISSMTEGNIISVEDSIPIYAWFDNGTIYWWSEAEKWYLNEDASYMFSKLNSVENIDTTFKTSNTTNIDGMFYNCPSLSSLDLSSFDTNNVTSMSGTFSSLSSLTSLDLSGFDTSNVTNMIGMFSGSAITSIDLSSFNTNNLENMSAMFAGCTQLTSLDLSNFNISNVTALSGLLTGCNSLSSLNISGWKFVKVTDLTRLFYGLTNLSEINLNNVDTSNVTNMTAMFQNCSKITSLDLSSFNTSSVTAINGMFQGCSSLETVNLSNFDFTNTGSPITNGSLISTPVKTLIFDNIVFPQNATHFFYNMTNVETISLVNADASNTTSMDSLFYNCSKLKNLDMSGIDTSSVTDMSSMFSGCSGLTSLDLSSFDTTAVTSMSYMFNGCSSLAILDLSMFNTSNVTSIDYLIGGCTSLETLNLSNWDFTKCYHSSNRLGYGNGGATSLKNLILDNSKFASSMDYFLEGLNNSLETVSFNNVDTSATTSMDSFFRGCSKIKKLDLSDFNTSSVTNTEYMFAGMSQLEKIVVSDNFVMTNVSSDGNMFYGDTNLVGDQGTVYDSTKFNGEYACYDGGESNPGYFSRDTSSRYTVTLNANGGSLRTTEISIKVGSSIGSLPKPSNANATFDGWYTGLTDGVKVDETFIPTGNVTLYARWR